MMRFVGGDSMKWCGFLLLLAALSGSLSAFSAEPLPASAPDAVGPVHTTKDGKTYYWLGPKPRKVPVHGCKPEHVRATTPTADFTDNRDGTVTHSRTGLVWMRCSLGQTWDGATCSGTAKKFLWQEAFQAAADLNAAGGYAGHGDWRLPNIKEIDSIAELQCFDPAINLDVFPGTPPWRFWSSTPSMNANDPRFAWFISFADAYVDDGRVVDFYFPDSGVKFAYHVRLVRGGAAQDSFAAPPRAPQ